MQAPKKAVPARDALRAKAKLTVEPLAAPNVDKAAIAEGRKPIPARRTEVAALRRRAEELYGLSAAGLSTPASIEKDFKFAAIESDASFQYLRAEALLNEAAVLLDGCLAIRTERDALQREKWKLQLELQEFFLSAELEDAEREAGRDTIPYEQALLLEAAQQSIEEYNKNAESQLNGLVEDLLASGFNKRMAARELSAWMAAYPLKDTELRGDDASYTFDGARRTKPDHLFEAARMEADEAAWEQVYLLMAQRFAAFAQAESGRLRKESAGLQTRWTLSSVPFNTQRAAIARGTGWEKVYQAQNADGVLNYQQQVAQLDRRFAAEFREALARLVAARRGLKELFDYAPAFPEEGTAGYLDDVVAWASVAQARLGQFAQSDQSYVLALSLKDLTATQWDGGLNASTWTFDITPQLFSAQTHVRLRGISIAVVMDNSDESTKQAARAGKRPTPKVGGFWSARISVPETGIMQTASDAIHQVDQKAIPVCHLGRVADRDAPQQPDIAGTDVLHNASPIGKGWKISLSPKSTDGTTNDVLQDVQLYLHLAVRGARA